MFEIVDVDAGSLTDGEQRTLLLASAVERNRLDAAELRFLADWDGRQCGRSFVSLNHTRAWFSDTIRTMPRTADTGLVPVWRSNSQPVILHEISLRSGVTAASIAGRHGLNRATVAYEVRRLIDANVITSTSVGRANQLALNWSNPATAHLVALADISVGLLVDLATLYDIDGVRRVAVFGSWARRHQGEPGPPPGDVDVLVETDHDPWPVEETCLAISGKRGVRIDPHILGSGPQDAVTSAILNGPLVEVSRR